jgi:sulfatase modifying factor 1
MRGWLARGACGLALVISAGAQGAPHSATAPIRAGSFVSALPPGEGVPKIDIGAFRLDRRPVTNAGFLAFVRKDSKWRRDRVARLFADSQYLSQWKSAVELGDEAKASQPVTRVSWYAAKAFCEARGARLPTWYEWEYVAAADERSSDARADPAWRQRILEWYSRPSGEALADVGHRPANYYGVFDIHGLTWEWVLDYNALLVASDSREQGGADRLKFCGEGALNMVDRDNYAVLMRIAFLSSLQAAYTTSSLGFRCAEDAK